MKKLIPLVIIVVVLSGCSGNKRPKETKPQEPKIDSGSFLFNDPYEDYYGTWRTAGVYTQGTRFTREQIEALGGGDEFDVVFIISENKTVVAWTKYDNQTVTAEWLPGLNDEYIFFGKVEVYYENGELYFAKGEDRLYLEKISDEQDIGIINELAEASDEVIGNTTEEPEIDETSSNSIRPDVKEAIDAYEDFVDEYIEFMKKYEDNDGTDLSILTDYLAFMNKLTDYTDKMEDMEDDLTDAEYLYYLEVLNRCNEKMIKALN